MSDDQAWLRAVAMQRFTEVGGGTPGGDVRVMTVVRSLDPLAFLAGTVAFAAGIPAGRREPWYRTFTRTLFFAGNPVSLAPRFPYDHAAGGGAIAWYGPAAFPREHGLVRALRLFRGPLPLPDPPGVVSVRVPGEPTGRTAVLRLAVEGVSAGEYLVHANHVLSESVLRGLIAPGDALLVRHTPGVDPQRARACPPDRTYLRVAEDPRQPGALRLYACLTTIDRLITDDGGESDD